MKRFVSWFFVILLIFAFGVVVTAIWLNHNSPAESYEQLNLAELPNVEYCDLKNNPERYSGKIVRLNAQLNWFMHGYFLADANCSGEGDSARAAVCFYENREEFYKSLERYREPHKLWEPLKIIAVGKFTFEKPRGSSDGIEDRTSLHFEIYKIESVAR